MGHLPNRNHISQLTKRIACGSTQVSGGATTTSLLPNPTNRFRSTPNTALYGRNRTPNMTEKGNPTTMKKEERKSLGSILAQSTPTPGRYYDGPGGNNLSLLVKETKTPGVQSTTWSVRIQINGKYTNRGLGSHPKVKLAEARRRALAYHQAVEEGRDPKTNKRPTFRQVTADTIEFRSPDWREGSLSRREWEKSFEIRVFSHIGDMEIDTITHHHIYAVLEPIWRTKHPTARKLQDRISAVMDRAEGKGYIESNPTLRAVKLLGKVRHQAQHHNALSTSQLKDALKTIEAPGPYRIAVNALIFLILTAARSGEVRKATWDQIDRPKKEWTMPGHNTKSGKPHRVPLSEPALRILEETDELARALGLSDGLTGLVFPSTTGKIMGSGSLLKLLHDNEFHDATVHGIRSTFTDWAAKHDVKQRVADAALAHGKDDPYYRTRHFQERVDVMRNWARHLGI